MREDYLRGLLVIGPALFFVAGLNAQSKADVVIGVMAIHINGERVEHIAARLPSPTAAELLTAFLTDKDTELVTRSQLRTDGRRLHFQIGADVAIDLIPEVQNREEMRLHVGITASALKPFAPGGALEHPLRTRNHSIANLSLRHGELNVLCGVNGIPGLTYIPLLDESQFGDQELMIALIPQIRWPSAPVR